MPKKYLTVLAVVSIASLTSVFLIILRVLNTGVFSYIFLNWNLFLAWVPLIIALFVEKLYLKSKKFSAGLLALIVMWLIFYPNAPYIITDLIHLRPMPDIPQWYDVLLVFSFAWTGFFLGFASMFIIHQIIKRHFNRYAGWGFVIVSNLLASFGIYLGRFFGWNSWDIVSNTKELTFDITNALLDPFLNQPVYKFTVSFAAVLIVLYLTLYSATKLRGD